MLESEDEEGGREEKGGRREGCTHALIAASATLRCREEQERRPRKVTAEAADAMLTVGDAESRDAEARRAVDTARAWRRAVVSWGKRWGGGGRSNDERMGNPKPSFAGPNSRWVSLHGARNA